MELRSNHLRHYIDEIKRQIVEINAQNYATPVLEYKLQQAINYKNVFLKTLRISTISNKELIKRIFDKEYQKLISLISSKLDDNHTTESSSDDSFTEQSNSSNNTNNNINNGNNNNNNENNINIKMDFDIGNTNKLIPLFEGQYTQVQNFINTIEYIYNLIKDTDKPRLIDFIYNIKLNQKVKNKIFHETKPTNLYELKTILENNFSTNRTYTKVHSEILQLCVARLPVSKLAEKLENLINELNLIQSKNQDQQTTATIKNVNDQFALQCFKNSLKDSIQPTVVASQPKTLAEAIKIAQEAESNNKNKYVMLMSQNKNNYNKYNKYNNNNNYIKNNNFNRNNNNNNFKNNKYFSRY